MLGLYTNKHEANKITKFYNISNLYENSRLSEIPDEFKWQFIRGFIETNSKLNSPEQHEEPCLTISFENETLLREISEYSKIPSELFHKNTLIYHRVNMIDFLGKIFSTFIGNITEYPYKSNLHFAFRAWLNWSSIEPVCQMIKILPDAVLPYKSRYSDVGLDLVIIKKAKQYNSLTTLYDTGIALNIPHGYYAEIVPRSSLSKTGYMLANSVGIIDNSYRGNLYIPLIKIVPDAPEIELPFRCCQLIFKKQVFMNVQEVHIIERTGRGEGGFGSTG
jgi:deoxyuridine 5'-triphosphate nucleotidohydrolase